MANEKANEKITAMVKAVAPERTGLSTTAFEPANFTEALSLASMMAQSQLVPQALRGKPHDVMLCMMMGRELGWTVWRSLGNISVIQGKPVISAGGLVALAYQSGQCEWFHCVSSDDKQATYETKRKGNAKPMRLTYTIEQARLAGLTNKDNWKRMPAEMLRARCSSSLVRIAYPDAAAGIYTQEEMGSSEVPRDAPPAPTETTVVYDPGEEPADMNPETGEVPIPPDPQDAEVEGDGEVLYAALTIDGKAAYWKKLFEEAENEAALTVISMGLRKMEPEGSPVREKLNAPYLAVLGALRAKARGGK